MPYLTMYNFFVSNEVKTNKLNDCGFYKVKL